MTSAWQTGSVETPGARVAPAAVHHDVRPGWGQYLPSLRNYIDTGTGNPHTPARLG